MDDNLSIIREHLTKHGVDYTGSADEPAVTAWLNLENLVPRLILHAPPGSPGWVTLVLTVPVAVPVDRRAAVGEFLLRVNYSLRLGSFELDFHDGEVRFRISDAFGERPVAEEMLTYWLLAATKTVDGFFPVLMRVIFAHMSPEQAVEQGEGFLRDLFARNERAEDAD